MTHPIPDRFRVGEVWASPRGKRWRVMRIDVRKGAVLVDAKLPNRSRQWRGEFAIGDNMMNAWLRIDPPHEANP
jgi:hypothetical protein